MLVVKHDTLRISHQVQANCDASTFAIRQTCKVQALKVLDTCGLVVASQFSRTQCRSPFPSLAWAHDMPQNSDGLADSRLAGGRNQLSIQHFCLLRCDKWHAIVDAGIFPSQGALIDMHVNAACGILICCGMMPHGIRGWLADRRSQFRGPRCTCSYGVICCSGHLLCDILICA